MKKLLIWLLCIVFTTSIAMVGISCKPETETTEGVEAAEEVAEEEIIEEEEAPPVEEIEITFLNNWVGIDPPTKMGAILTKEFNEKYKGKYEVIVEGVPGFQEMLIKLKTEMAAGESPDIFLIGETVKAKGTWLDGILADLSPFIDDEFLSYKSQGVWADCTADGKIVGIPYTDMSTAIFYNKTMFEKADIQLPIKTWDEFFIACDKLKAAGYTPIALETLESWVPMLMFTAFLGGYGGADTVYGLEDFNDPAFLEGAKFLLKLKDYTTSDALGAPYETAATNFIQEKTAMISNGPWMIADMKAVEGFYEKVDVMPYPGYTADVSPIMISGCGIKFCVNKEIESDPEKMKGVMEFLKYFNMPENIVRMVVDSGTIIRTNNADYSTEDAMEPLTIKILDYLDKEAMVTVPNIRAEVSHGFDKAFPEELGNLWMGASTPEQFIQAMNKKVFNK